MPAPANSAYLAPREVWEKRIAAHMRDVDPKWIAVDKFTTEHLDHETSAVSHTQERTAEAGMPPIACSAVQAKFMSLMCYGSNATHALEIGTLGGLTAIRLAQMNPNLHVTTIELHDVYAQVARQNIAAAGFQDRIEVLVGSALDVLPTLATEIEAGKRHKFGIALIDADESNNLVYMDHIRLMSLPRGLIFLDNVDIRDLDSRVMADTNGSARKETHSVALVETIGKDPRYEAVVLQTVGQKGRQGFMICVIKDE